MSSEDAGVLFAPFETVGSCLLAVSGGPDSTALLGLMAAWSRGRNGPALMCATVDHGLRPESHREAAAVAALCAHLQVPHAILTLPLSVRSRPGHSELRAARYRALVEHAQAMGASHILTGHTRDDQAETVLLRLARGSGLDGLAAMRVLRPLADVMLARPLLSLPKGRLVATCDALGWPYVCDPSNFDARHVRARLRHAWPILEREGLSSARLALLARRMARACDALQAAAHSAFAAACEPAEAGTASVRLRVSPLLALPDEIGLRVLALAIEKVANGTARLRLERLEVAMQQLIAAASDGRTHATTLMGCTLRLDKTGTIVVAREPIRRRGRAAAR